MCPPAALLALSIATSVASAGVGYMGQVAQFNAASQRYTDNAKSAVQATVNQWDASQIRISQEGASAVQNEFESSLATRKAVSTANTAAGEGGVSGLSVDYLTHDLYAQGGRKTDSIDTNLAMDRSYAAREMDAQGATGQNQINSVPIPEAPNPMAAIIGVFGSGLKSYTGYQQQIA